MHSWKGVQEGERHLAGTSEIARANDSAMADGRTAEKPPGPVVTPTTKNLTPSDVTTPTLRKKNKLTHQSFLLLQHPGSRQLRTNRQNPFPIPESYISSSFFFFGRAPLRHSRALQKRRKPLRCSALQVHTRLESFPRRRRRRRRSTPPLANRPRQ
ncbi:hypothetical protein BC835DRAFT_14881 [Cytidiella melzeri]|nr:hypothetical protein BC835DRAFT_14881 [Cytidiella melzeri]